MSFKATRFVFACIILLMAIMVFSYTALAATYSISGTVKSMTTGKGAPYAEIAVYDASANGYVITTYADGSGNYTAYVPSAGDYTVSASAAGFEDKSTENMEPIQLTETTAVATGIDIWMSAVIPLSPGWNFISFPRQPVVSAIDTVFASIASKTAIVWGYDNTTKQWLKWKPQGASQNTLTAIDSGKGYWVYMTDSAYIDMSTWDLPNDWVYLTPGWNLVGFAGIDGKGFASALGAFDGKWSIIWNWENNQWYAKDSVIATLPFPSIDKFYEGRGYWVKIKQSGEAASWDQAPATVWNFTCLGNPIAGAAVTITAVDGTLLYRENNATVSEGLFFATAEKLPSSFILEIAGGTAGGNPFAGYYKNFVSAFSPHETYTANEITTLIAAYKQKYPAKTYDQVVAAVKAYLSIPVYADMDAVIKTVPITGIYFSQQRFWDARGSALYGDFINVLVNEIGTGTTRNFSDPSAAYSLSPLFDISEWEFSGTQPLGKIPEQITPKAAGVGTFIEVALEIVEGIQEDIEHEENVATLNRIDESVSAILKEVNEIKETLKNQFQSITSTMEWYTVHSKQKQIEDNFIVPAFVRYRDFIKAKHQYEKAKQQSPQPSGMNDLRENLTEARRLFITEMNKKSSEISFDNFFEVLKIYQNNIMTGFSGRSAIEQYAQYLVDRMSSDDNTAYQKLEEQFLKQIYMQLISLKMIKQYKEAIAKCPSCGLDTLAPYTVASMTEAIITGSLNMNGDTQDPAMVKQAVAFEKAAEMFVVNHTNPAWYEKWMKCDNLRSVTAPSGLYTCTEQERPLTRSMYLSDAIIGKVKKSKDRYGAFYASDTAYDDYGKGGLFMKLISIKGQDNASGLGNPDDRSTWKSVLASDASTNNTFRMTVTALRDIAGANPYKAVLESSGGALTWQVATYRMRSNVSSSYTNINPNLSEWVGLHPLAETTFFSVHTETTEKLSLTSVKNTASGMWYSFYNGWMVPVRDGSLSLMIDRGWCLPAGDRNPKYPVKIDGYNAGANLFRGDTSITDGTGGQPLRFYHLGVNEPNYAIGYFYNNRRHFMRPHKTGDEWYVMGIILTGHDDYWLGWRYENRQIEGWITTYDRFTFTAKIDDQVKAMGGWYYSDDKNGLIGLINEAGRDSALTVVGLIGTCPLQVDFFHTFRVNWNGFY